MSGNYWLDTTIVIALLAHEDVVLRSLATAFQIHVPWAVIGELGYAALKSSRSAENLEKVNTFAFDNTVLDCNIEPSRLYGHVKHKLALEIW